MNRNNRNTNKNKRRFRRINFYRRNRNTKYSSRMRIPLTSQKPITMGFGTTTLNVSLKQTLSSYAVYQLSLSDLFYNSVEFSLLRNQFIYFKVNYVKIIWLPDNQVLDNKLSDGNMIYQYMAWVQNHSISDDELENGDNSKAVSMYRTKKYCYTFLPPKNIISNAYTSNMNVGGFNSTAQYRSFPGWLYVSYPTEEIEQQLLIEVNVIFRGRQLVGGLTLVKDILDIYSKKDKNLMTKCDKNEIKEKMQKEKEKLNEMFKLLSMVENDLGNDGEQKEIESEEEIEDVKEDKKEVSKKKRKNKV